MGWTSMSFPGSSYLPASTMNAVFSNFASAILQESGAPLPFNGWQTPSLGTYGPGVSSYGSVNAASYFSAGGQPARVLIQTAQNSSAFQTANAGAAQVYSTFLIASLTPKFGDSLIKVMAFAGGMAQPMSYTSRFTACITRGVTSLLLTPGVGSAGYPFIGDTGAGGLSIAGTLALFAEETSPGSGTAVQYALRWADAISGTAQARFSTLLVEEWR